MIDTLFNHSKDKDIAVFAKLYDKDVPIEIKNGNFPEDVATSYNILYDNTEQIIKVIEFPFSESGDWFISLTHYFDKDGKTFAFERKCNFFNAEGIAYETQTEFFNGDFKPISTDYKLIDENGNTLQKDDCDFPYSDINVNKKSANIDMCLKANTITNAQRNKK
ncbi:MAG: hypothetical protein LBV75_03565, partial [Paludibacter sp.]|nr:hypothetical protein [Paludibacter sp.]